VRLCTIAPIGLTIAAGENCMGPYRSA